MKNVIKNGLKQDLTFKGALHLSLKDKKVNDYNKLVINVNKTERRTWVDMIVIYDMLSDTWESFRIGGEILESLGGHQDLHKWLDICVDELDWKGVISDSNKDTLILEIFNFVNGVSEVLITPDTEFNLKDEDGLGVETFYPWPENGDDPEEDEDDEEITLEGEDEENFVNLKSPSKEVTEELINFENFEYEGIHERGGNKRSEKYLDKRVGSVIYAIVETDEEGNEHIIGGDVLKASKSIYGSPYRVVSIYNMEDIRRIREGADEVVERIIKSSDLTLQSEIVIAEVVLKIDLEKLLDKIEEGLKWKESLNNDTDPVAADEDDEY